MILWGLRVQLGSLHLKLIYTQLVCINVQRKWVWSHVIKAREKEIGISMENLEILSFVGVLAEILGKEWPHHFCSAVLCNNYCIDLEVSHLKSTGILYLPGYVCCFSEKILIPCQNPWSCLHEPFFACWDGSEVSFCLVIYWRSCSVADGIQRFTYGRS